MCFSDDWFGPSIDDLREDAAKRDADRSARRRALIARHEAAGGNRPLGPPVVHGDEFVSGEDIADRELWEAYQEEDRRR